MLGSACERKKGSMLHGEQFLAYTHQGRRHTNINCNFKWLRDESGVMQCLNVLVQNLSGR
ncbi:hypothetical protein J6590_075193, partial [Homalodisca vitripennis]